MAALPGRPAPDWRPTANWDRLALRSRLLGELRRFFQERQFLEVETPLLSADVVVDRHLEPFAVEADSPGGGRLWLQTSPEFGMKRLMAAGGQAIYQVTRAFRRHERGPLHNPEFTLVEWYRRGDGLAEGMQLLSDLVERLLGLGPAARLSYAQAFTEYAGVEPHSAPMERLAEAARARGLRPPASLTASDRDGWLEFLLVELVQPHLGQAAPVILYDYPASQAALAKVRQGPPPVAERFELFARGIELANGYHELLDPSELAERGRLANQQRALMDKRVLPEASRLLEAMEHGLPKCSGAALGFDRLVMLAAGASAIDEVLSFPIERA
ncbi:MAG: EF-P lysine aminoacylase EpmA [Pirellulales bacterium]